jgi:hypothetical protein
MFSSWQNPHIGSLKATWKSLELPIPRKIANQKQYHLSGGISGIGATLETSKLEGW